MILEMGDRKFLHDLFRAAQNDPELQNTLDIDALLGASTKKPMDLDVSRPKYDMRKIAKQNMDVLKSIEPPLSADVISNHYLKLQNYYPIEELHELHIGKYIKWISKDDTSKFKTGGNLMGVKFGETGILLTIRTFYFGGPRIFNLKFDNHYIFQKIAEEDLMIGLLT